jgi:hypothetical protein
VIVYALPPAGGRPLPAVGMGLAHAEVDAMAAGGEAASPVGEAASKGSTSS